MNHKQLTKVGVGVAIVGATLFATSSAFAAATTTPMKSIADSWHNLGSGNIKSTTPNGGTPSNHSNDTAEVCVFCHTPHGGDNSASVPLWNRQLGLSGTATYKRYSDLGTSTFDASEAPVGSVTIACLSCHDGTQAIDSVLNAPGSGGWTGTAARLGTNFGGADQANGQLAPTASGVVQNLGTDLSNDHPVSMQYAGGGVRVGQLDGPTNDRDFVAGSNPVAHPAGFTLEHIAAGQGAQGGITTLWWIERGGDSLVAGTRDREDVILYTRIENGTGNARIDGIEQPFVECGSCHDPHNVSNPTFLRVSNGVPADSVAGFPNPNGGPSGLCLTCHIK
jgi:hypothetical protein